MSSPAARKVRRWRRRRLTFLAGAVILATAIALIWTTTQHNQTSPNDRAATQSTPPSASADITARRTNTPGPATPTPTPQAPPGGAPITDDTTVITIGDSIMAGYGLNDPTTSAWPIRIGAQLHTPVVNDSCSGAGFIAVGDCGTNYAGLLPTAVNAHPALVLVQSSDNDEGDNPEQLAAATTQTLKTLHAALPDARIVGLSTLWDQPGTMPAEVEQSSTDLEQAVTAVGGTYVAVGQPIAGQAGLLQSDSEHPTDLGQQALATAIIGSLRTNHVLP